MTTLPQTGDPTAAVAQSADIIRHIVQEVLNQLAQPVPDVALATQTLGLVEERLLTINGESLFWTAALDRLQGIAAQLQSQRDEAIMQRDVLAAVSGLAEYVTDISR